MHAWMPEVQRAASIACPPDVSSLVKSLVPSVADWCFLDVLDERGELERQIVVHADPNKADLARELGKIRPGPDWPLVNGRKTQANEWSGAHRAALDKIAARSCVVSPLLVGEKILGSLTAITAESGRRFGPDDLERIRQLSVRVASGLHESSTQRRAVERIRGFAEIVDSFLDGVVAIDARANVVLTNESAIRILGLPRERVLRPVVEVIENMGLRPLEGLEKSLNLVHAALRGTAFNPTERTFVDSTGAMRTFRTAISPIRFGDDVIGALVMFGDVTAERALLSAERSARVAVDADRERFRNLLEQAPIAVLVTESPSHLVTLQNALGREFFGGDLVGKMAREMPRAEEQGVLAILDKVLATGEPAEIRDFHASSPRHPDGRFLTIWFHAIRDAQNAVTGVIAGGTDVTEQVLARRRVEEARAAAEASEARYRSVVESIPELVWTTGADQTVDYCNRRWEDYTGLPGDRLRDRLFDTFHPDDFASWTLRSADAVRKRTGFELEVRLRNAAGHHRWHLMHTFPLCDAERRVIKWFGCAIDIDDRKRAELERAELRERERALRTEAESARLKDEFLARVSHELRAPLSAISMWVHVLREGDGADRDAALTAIEQSTKAQARLIDDLLDEVRAQSGTLRVALEPMDPRAPVEAALIAMRPLAEEKGIRLESNVDLDVGTIRGDARRLQQVMQNLLSNAIEFTPAMGRIQVSLHREGRAALISVTDTGEGIDPEFLPYVFAPFRQADSTTTRRHGGLGLGLSIVRELVERHSGTVRAESEGSGKGATFTVALPLSHTPSRPPPPMTDETVPPMSLDRIRVLLVEDDDLTRDGLALLLERRGAIVTTAAAASEAILCMQESLPDVLVCDIAMPGIDGYSLIARVRANEGGKARLPAIALTAHSGPEDRAKSIAAGFDLHLTKPVDVDELVRIIGRGARRS